MVAEFFVSGGYDLTISARSSSNVQTTINELSDRGNIIGINADVSDCSEIKGVFSKHIEAYGGIDVVINAAALQNPIGAAWDCDPLEWAIAIQANLIGCFNVLHNSVPLMQLQKTGVIIFFSGGGAAYARPNFSAYGASKAGVLRLVETVQEELQEQETSVSIRVYAIAPGAVKTRLTEEVLLRRRAAGKKAFQEALKTQADGGTSPQKAAELCLFLAERKPSCLAGRMIHVNEPYREFVEKFEGKDLGDSGMLRRQGYGLKES